MVAPTVLILGGYGNYGFALGEALLRHSNAQVILAGRNTDKARTAAAQLNAASAAFMGDDFGICRVTSWTVDAADQSALNAAFGRADWVVSALGTTRYTHALVKALLQNNANCMDMQYMPGKLAVWHQYAAEIRATGHCVITEAGLLPGLPGWLVRFVASQIPRLQEVRIGMYLNPHRQYLLSMETWRSLTAARAATEHGIFFDGAWHDYGNRKEWNFAPGLGKMRTNPIYLAELYSLPAKYPELHEVALYVTGDGWTEGILASSAWRWFGGYEWSMPWLRVLQNRHNKLPYGVMIQLEAVGMRERQRVDWEISLSHPDPYHFSAQLAALCLAESLKVKSTRCPGVWLQAQMFVAENLLNILRISGVTVTLKENGRALEA